MVTRLILTGRKARFICAEIADLSAENQELLYTLMEQALGREKDMKLILKVLQNEATIGRIAGLLREGKPQEAESVVMKLIHNRNKKR